MKLNHDSVTFHDIATDMSRTGTQPNRTFAYW
eukprot:COSAG04_NODE_567_length_12551_cov_8.279553_14_plen_32_part_00